MATLRYPYRPKPLVMALAGLFFAGCGVILFMAARGNDRGLVLNGMIRFSTSGATTFYWVLTACCVGFVAFAILGVARAFGSPREVVLDDRALMAPKSGVSGTVVTVPLASITDLRLQEVSGQRFLTIRHAGGKLNISGSMLPSKDDLETLAIEIGERRAAPPAPVVEPPGAASPARGFGRRGL